MATSISSAFICKLLAPIADSEEQADTKAFRKEVRSDIALAWRRGMNRVELAKAKQTIAWANFRASGERYITDRTPCALAVQAANAMIEAAEHRQCLLLAPRPADMRWKKRSLRFTQAVPDDIAAAIARDEARFAEGC